VLSAQNQLVDLISQVHGFLTRVNVGAEIGELRLRKARIVEALDQLETTVGEPAAGAIGQVSNHLNWLLRWYERSKPDNYASDIVDLYEHDLPAVAAAVAEWLNAQVDPRLMSAVNRSWMAQHYASAVREAFICLESELRVNAGPSGSSGMSGDKLVTAAFKSVAFTDAIRHDGFMGELTDGELKGLEYFLRGTFLLFRNATAHREVAYSAVEAEGIILTVNHCLRFIPQQV